MRVLMATLILSSFRPGDRVDARALRGRCASRVHAYAAGLALACAASAATPARANCFDDAAAYQHVNPLILRAIAWQESRNQPGATHANANGSTDYGVMQINSIHLAALSRYGITRAELMAPCKNIYIAAWQLRRMIVKYGNTWAAVGAYHSATPALRDRYARQIAAILRSWNVLPEQGTGAGGIERVSASRNVQR
uniref:Lytic transglycosylase catalytic n=1 Tax=Burkholderia sp. (strain CCGE1003) TaxID=640512 RepID=E1TI86_BURSG